MQRSFYSDSILNFRSTSSDQILGKLAQANDFSLETTQKDAWIKQIEILKTALSVYNGKVFFEYAIPRMGKRVDTILIIKNVIFILEFKVGESEFLSSNIDQVLDYALDLKNFHETSHNQLIAPVLIATKAKNIYPVLALTPHNDNVLFPVNTNGDLLKEVIESVLQLADGNLIDQEKWEQGRYSPTPTIIEAAMALYSGHQVGEISRGDAGAKNLTETSSSLKEIILRSREKKEKAICFVTGVPGAGKTLVGLDIATKNLNKDKDLTSISFRKWTTCFHSSRSTYKG